MIFTFFFPTRKCAQAVWIETYCVSKMSFLTVVEDKAVFLCGFHCKLKTTFIVKRKCASYSPDMPMFVCTPSHVQTPSECQTYARLRGCFSLTANRVQTTHRAGVSSLCVPCSEPPVVLMAGVCTESDRLKLVCEYEMPAVTHPIVPLTLVQPELVCFHVQCSCCCGKAAKHHNHKRHTHIKVHGKIWATLQEHSLKREFHTPFLPHQSDGVTFSRLPGSTSYLLL